MDSIVGMNNANQRFSCSPCSSWQIMSLFATPLASQSHFFWSKNTGAHLSPRRTVMHSCHWLRLFHVQVLSSIHSQDHGQADSRARPPVHCRPRPEPCQWQPSVTVSEWASLFFAPAQNFPWWWWHQCWIDRWAQWRTFWCVWLSKLCHVLPSAR